MYCSCGCVDETSYVLHALIKLGLANQEKPRRVIRHEHPTAIGQTNVTLEIRSGGTLVSLFSQKYEADCWWGVKLSNEKNVVRWRFCSYESPSFCCGEQSYHQSKNGWGAQGYHNVNLWMHGIPQFPTPAHPGWVKEEVDFFRTRVYLGERSLITW